MRFVEFKLFEDPNQPKYFTVGDSHAEGVAAYTGKPWINKAKHSMKSTEPMHMAAIREIPKGSVVLISLGANDYKGIDTESNIRRLRVNSKADKVFWLLPSSKLKPTQVEAVKRVALEFGDIVIPRPETDISADGVHPTYTGYKKLAEKTR